MCVCGWMCVCVFVDGCVSVFVDSMCECLWKDV